MKDQAAPRTKQQQQRKRVSPPKFVTVQHLLVSARKARNRVVVVDEVSHMTVDDQSTWSDTMYYRYHPIIWMLLMFMAVGLHNRYQMLFNEQDPTAPAASFTLKADDHVQRRTSGPESGIRTTDMSGLVMSLLDPTILSEEAAPEPTVVLEQEEDPEPMQQAPFLRGALFLPVPEQKSEATSDSPLHNQESHPESSETEEYSNNPADAPQEEQMEGSDQEAAEGESSSQQQEQQQEPAQTLEEALNQDVPTTQTVEEEEVKTEAKEEPATTDDESTTDSSPKDEPPVAEEKQEEEETQSEEPQR